MNTYTLYTSLSLFCMYIHHTTSLTHFHDLHTESSSHTQFLQHTYQLLHQHPELFFREYETSNIIQQILTENNIPFTTGWGVNPKNSSEGGTGILAQLGTGNPPCLAIRADIDGLPIQETVDLPYKSTHPGRMHSCGHDAHTTMLLGAAKLLKAHESELQGTIKFLFQPAEEGGGGAHVMIKEGVLDIYPPIEMMYAFHITPQAETGAILSAVGPITAAANLFTITVKGRGGHVAKHHQNIDAIAAGGAISQNLYTLNAREVYFQQQHAGVISITNIQSGHNASFNVIPEEMVISGTIRTLTQQNLQYLMKRVEEICTQTSSAYNTHVNVQFYDPVGLVPTYNHQTLYDIMCELAPEAASDKKLGVRLPSLGGEDFAYFSQAVPSLLSYLGMGSGHVGLYPTNVPYHSPNFVMDQTLFPRASAFYAYLTLQTLSRFNKQTPPTNDEL